MTYDECLSICNAAIDETYRSEYKVVNNREQLFQALQLCLPYLEKDVQVPEIWDVAGEILILLEEYKEGIDFFLRTFEKDKVFFVDKLLQSSLYLSIGDYWRGWVGSERRLAYSKADDKNYRAISTADYWKGHFTDAKQVLLLHDEAGLGDTIQFIRFLPEVKKRLPNGKIILLIKSEVACLLDEFGDCYDQLITYGVGMTLSLPRFDMIAALMSLPLILGIENERGFWQGVYVFSSKAEVVAKRKILDTGDRKNVGNKKIAVGLVWGAGNAEEKNIEESDGADFVNKHGQARSLGCEELLCLCQADNVKWYALQKGSALKDFPALIAGGMDIVTLDDKIKDFRDTAAFIANMDMVVTVDTAVAHLAGAMGKETLLLLNKEYIEWRWRIDQDITAWYPSIRIFWQEEPGKWGSAIDKLIEYLQLSAQCCESEEER